MTGNETRHSLPPVIRIFLSSTFSDMENERTYFNEHLAPEFSRMCARRGVSFFSVDLRWGITEEEQVNGKVLPICLQEIDRCRPFFVGILGNRYGSVMETVPEGIGESIPWLRGKEGRSITELEMLYATLDTDSGMEARNAAFFIRSDALSESWYGKSETPAPLCALKARITGDESVISHEYATLEAFGEMLSAEFEKWLDSEFPAEGDMRKARRDWYDRELLRNYMPMAAMHDFLDIYLRESTRPIMLHGDGARGKTTLLTAWKPESGKKVLINCASDDAFLYWPSIAQEIVSRLNETDPSFGRPDAGDRASASLRILDMFRSKGAERSEERMDAGAFMVSDEDRRAFRRNFIKWLSGIAPKQPIYIVINDLDLLEDSESRLLTWLPVFTHENLRVICSSNNPEMLDAAEILGWNLKEMTLFDGSVARDYTLRYLSVYGKNLSAAQLERLLRAPAAAYPGELRFALNFLIDHGRFHNLDSLIDAFAEGADITAMYRFIFDHIAAGYSENERLAAETVFGILRCAIVSLTEQEVRGICEGIVTVTAIEWARIRTMFEQFALIRGDYWNLRSAEVRKFADGIMSAGQLARIQSALGDFMLEKLRSESEDRRRIMQIREKTAFAKAALHHYRLAGDHEKLLSVLQDGEALSYLAKLEWQEVRRAWVELLLNSETDVAERLFDLIRKYKGGYGDSGLIVNRISELFVDLELRGHLEKVQAITGRKYISSSFIPDFSEASREFADIYNMLCGCKEKGDFRNLYEQVNRYLHSREWKPIEKCSLYFFKAEAEEHLGMYRDSFETVNLYYRCAVLASSEFDIRRALGMRGTACYRLEQWHEAEQINRKAAERALQCGAVRDYLGAGNVLAMCLYRAEKYDESMRQFNELHRCWLRLGNEAEAFTIAMNRCNVLYLKKDVRGAMEMAEKMLDGMGPAQTPRMRQVRQMLISNMGKYALELEDHERAEKLLKQAIRECEAAGQNRSIYNSLMSLGDLYRKTDRMIDYIETTEKAMELLWEHHEYGQVRDMLKKCLGLLAAMHSGYIGKAMESRWEARFSALPEEVRRHFMDENDAVYDERQADALREQLAVAKGERDSLKAAQILEKLAGAIRDEKPESIRLLIEAAEAYRRSGRGPETERCLAAAAEKLFEGGRALDEKLYSELYGHAGDPAPRRVLELWKRVGDKADADEAAVSFVGKLFKQYAKSKAGYGAETFMEIAGLAEKCESYVIACLQDLTADMVDSCTAAQIVNIIRCLPGNVQAGFLYHFATVILGNFERDTNYLTGDYESPKAAKLLEYYEKCLTVLRELDITDVQKEMLGAVYGNLAIIYRRRKDKERTMAYHTMSMEMYEKCGKNRDRLIEIMNMATACLQLDEAEKGFEMLRKGISEARKLGEARLEASMAGNLASELSRRGEGNARETAEYFLIEENYFRSVRMYRDLAISLANQLLFYRKSKGISRADAERKHAELMRIIREYGLKDIEQGVRRMGLDKLDASEAPAAAGSPEWIVGRLLSLDGRFRLDELTCKDGVYRACCIPVEKTTIEQELMNIFFVPGKPFRMQITMVSRQAIVGEKTAELIEPFIEWWNGQGFYELSWHDEDRVLRAVMVTACEDLSKLAGQYAAMQKMWNVDKLSVQSAALGIFDVEMSKKRKIELMNGN